MKIKLTLGIIVGLLVFTIGGTYLLNSLNESVDAIPVGAPPPKVVTIDQVLSFIEAYQDDYFLTNGQYKMILKNETWADKYIMPDDIAVHWYESKLGKGFMITQTRVIETAPNGSTTFTGENRRWGYGPQALEFTHDWKQI